MKSSNIDSRTIRYFIEVADNRSIRVASDRLHVASSAISRKIAMLEQSFGIQLFERTTHGMALTSAGEAYRAYAHRLMIESERVYDEIASFKGSLRGHIRVALINGMTTELGVRVWSRFHALYPNVTVEIQASGADLVNKALFDRTVDIGVSASAEREVGITRIARMRTPVLAVMSTKNKLKNAKRLKLKDIISAYPIALPDRTFTIRRQLDACAEFEKIKLVPDLITNSVEVLREYARSSYGVTFLPEIAIKDDLRKGHLCGMKLSNPILNRSTIDILVPAGRYLSPPVKAFIECMKETTSDLQSDALFG